MSYLNISYSTLEDAWGGGFEKREKRKVKKDSEVCNLYKQRHNATYRPYKTVMESDYIKPMYTEDNYVKYHGYKDGRPYSRPRHRLSKYKVTLPTFTKGTHRYLSEDEDDEFGSDPYPLEEEEEYMVEHEESDDDPYMDNALYANERGRSNYISPIIDPTYAKKALAGRRPNRADHPPAIQKPYREIRDVSDGYKETPFSYIDGNNKSATQPIYVQQEDDDDFDGNDMDTPSAVDLANPSKSDRSNTPSSTTKQPYLYEVDYDDDFDGYFKSELGSDLDDIKDPLTCAKPDTTTVAQRPYDSSRRRAVPHPSTHPRSSQYDRVLRAATKETFVQPGAVPKRGGDHRGSISDDRVYIDLALYTISGIILIFIMEQFVQIGQKIKNRV